MNEEAMTRLGYSIAVLKWLWACPLRASILMGGATYFGLRRLPWNGGFARQAMPIFFSLMVAVVGYFWQSAREQAKKEKRP